MAIPKKKIAVIGCGTYNPPTLMHLRMFELARDYLKKKLNYEEVNGIISPVNDLYKNVTSKFILDSRHRCNMVKLALRGIGPNNTHWVRLDDWECKQSEWFRTLEVLKHFHQEINRSNDNDNNDNTDESEAKRCKMNLDKNNHKNTAKVQLMLLCGADMFDSFNVPGLWSDEHLETILSDYGLIVITREGNDPWDTIKNSDKSQLISKYKHNIHIIEDKVKNGISSSFVRAALGRGESVRYLIDDAVLEYIQENNLYGFCPSAKS